MLTVGGTGFAFVHIYKSHDDDFTLRSNSNTARQFSLSTDSYHRMNRVAKICSPLRHADVVVGLSCNGSSGRGNGCNLDVVELVMQYTILCDISLLNSQQCEWCGQCTMQYEKSANITACTYCHQHMWVAKGTAGFDCLVPVFDHHKHVRLTFVMS